MTVSLPDPMKEWIEAQIRKGEYASASDYVRDLVRRDRERRGHQFTLEELRDLVETSRESGRSSRTVECLFNEAERLASTPEPKRG